MTGAVLVHPVVRAIQDQKVSPGVLGFLVVAALGVATWLLIRSMTRQIHKIDFSEAPIDVGRRKAAVTEAETPTGAVGSADHDRGGSTPVVDGEGAGDPGSDHG
jgi:hypothetical protein